MSEHYDVNQHSLAAYATQDDEHGRRLYQEEELYPSYRTAFQRDRDRIVHSKAFRRLGYKTQVFVNSEGDLYRNRLTHSLEVAQIARSVSYALRLNQDFAEALALAHDLGHSPFAHAGQNILNQLMKNYGGFEHNCQGLRQLSKLEFRYLDFPGLNLSRTTLIGMMKHAKVYDFDYELLPLVQERLHKPYPLEALLVDLCDRVAYLHHDIEDGLHANLLELSEIQEIPWWAQIEAEIQKRKKERFSDARQAIRIRVVIRHMLYDTIQDLISHSQQSLGKLKVSMKKQAKAIPVPIREKKLQLLDQSSDQVIGFSKGMASCLQVLHKFLYTKLYSHPRVIEMSKHGAHVIETLFHYFIRYPEKMPQHYQELITKEGLGLERVVADYIAGMTDRFAYQEYKIATGSHHNP